jgi:lipopolysaccharide heptosyltransferase I
MPDPAAQTGDADRIVMVRLSAIGDVVNTLPALTALRRARREAHIAWICETASAGLLEGHPLLDEAIVLDRKNWVRGLTCPCGIARLPADAMALRRRLRAGRFNIAIDFQGNFRSGLVTRLTGARTRVGLARRHGREMSHLFVNRRVSLPDGPVHRVERALHLVASLGIDTADAQPVVPATEPDRERVAAVLAEHGLEPGRFAVMAAGSSAFGRYKQWTRDGWTQVASRLHDEQGLPVLLVRGPDPSEAEEAEAIAGAAHAEAHVAPLLSLRELGELCRQCHVFLGVDSGPTHLASAAGARVVALFGPKDPQIYRPYFGQAAVVEKPLHCRPCTRRSCDEPQCMLAITPDDVMAKVNELIS